MSDCGCGPTVCDVGALSMSRGDTLIFQVDATDPALAGAPMSLTGWVVAVAIKRYLSDPDPFAVFTARSTDASPAIVISDAALGQVQVTVPAIATIGFADGPVRLVWAMKGKSPSGAVRTLAEGTITVNPSASDFQG